MQTELDTDKMFSTFVQIAIATKETRYQHDENPYWLSGLRSKIKAIEAEKQQLMWETRFMWRFAFSMMIFCVVVQAQFMFSGVERAAEIAQLQKVSDQVIFNY